MWLNVERRKAAKERRSRVRQRIEMDTMLFVFCKFCNEQLTFFSLHKHSRLTTA